MGMIQSWPFQRSVNTPPESAIEDSRITSNAGQNPVREVDKQPGFLRWLFLLVSLKVSWSPAVIAGEFWKILTNIGKHREILRLLKLRPFDEIVQNNPGFAFKYTVPNYLARGLTVTERVSCFLHHYRRMHATLPENVLRHILRQGVTLYVVSNGVNSVSVTMGMPEQIGRLEGELSLDLQVDGKDIFNLSFIIIPGWVVKSEVAEVLLVTRLQGTKGCKTQINLARKTLHDYSQRTLLLAALQGIADALGIGEIEAVCATNQRCYEGKYAAYLESCYDDFFAEVGMVKTAGFYSSPVPIEGKPLASIRARKRRALRQQIRSACASFLLGLADRAADPTSFAGCSASVPAAVESQPSPVSCSPSKYTLTP
jgi:uncharacterized protein VirK/YbjX